MARMVRSSAVVAAETKENAFTRWGDVLANRHRLGLNLAHISNASIHDKNAGEEEFYITYAITFWVKLEAPGRERLASKRCGVE